MVDICIDITTGVLESTESKQPAHSWTDDECSILMSSRNMALLAPRNVIVREVPLSVSRDLAPEILHRGPNLA